MKFLKPWLMIVGFLVVSANVQAQVNNSALGKVLQDYVNQLQTFEADFVQIRPDEERFVTETSLGHFKLNRPGQLTWEYFDPEPQKIVVDGPNLWFYDMDLDQVTVRPIDDVRAELPLSWLLYQEPIQERFSIIESKSQNDVQWFNLTPKQATYFQSIDIAMKKGEMSEIWVYQGRDNIIKVKFDNIASNQVIPQQKFQFKVPEGADLVGSPQ